MDPTDPDPEHCSMVVRYGTVLTPYNHIHGYTLRVEQLEVE